MQSNEFNPPDSASPAVAKTPPTVALTPPADPLLLLELLERGDARALGSLVLGRKLDLGALGAALIRDRLAVYASARFSELGLRALLPRTLSDALRDQYEAQQRRNARLTDIFGEVQQAFKAAGLDLMVLKGLPFAARFASGIDRRFCWDLDLLVRERDFIAATAVLTGLGFAKPNLTFAAEHLAWRLSHAVELTRGDTSLDLHWTFRNRPGIRFDEAAIWAGRQAARVEDLACWVPSSEDQLLQLLVGLAFDLERGHARLRTIWDVRWMLAAMPGLDWASFLAHRTPDGLRPLVANALALVVCRLDLRAELPALALALDRETGALLVRSAEEARILLGRPRQSLANRHWFARLQPLLIWAYWVWWAGTTPVRYLLGRSL